MLTLYVKTGCPYCELVEETLAELKVDAVQKNVQDEGVWEELEKRGGMRQVPYLVDDSTGAEMYESEDIVDYLRQHYGKQEER